MGIIPKMAVRFSSFEAYKEVLQDSRGKVRSPWLRPFLPTTPQLTTPLTHDVNLDTRRLPLRSGHQVSQSAIFLAGLGSGVTEAVMVVTPAEVCKIRLQVRTPPPTLLPAPQRCPRG